MVLTLTLVRHGQTEFNAQSRLQGWCDSPLTTRGLVGARVTGAHLAAHPFVAAYVSPAGRAQSTAREILAHHPHAQLVTDPDLREFGFGELEGRPESELLTRYDPDTMFTGVVRGTFEGIAGGEAGRPFLDRVRAAFTRIERNHRDGHVLVVSHGLTLRAYLTAIDARPIAPLPNASISMVEVSTGHRRVTVLAHDPSSDDGIEARDARPVPALAV